MTPILGMLSLIQEEQLRSPTSTRSKVHFVWATRNPNDFHFLDPLLLEEARYSTCSACRTLRGNLSSRNATCPQLWDPAFGLVGQLVAMASVARA